MKLRPDASALRNLLSYDPETGILRWKTRPGPKSNVRAGDEAGRIVSCSNRSGGYKSRRVTVMGREYQSHHVAWCIVTGEWPATEIDHIDKNPMNDRWSNLRLATRVQQAANRNLQSNNTSGYKGVRWSKRDKKWIARITFDGNIKDLGYFDNPEEAAHAYNKGAIRYHGEFATLNLVGGNFA